MTRHGATGWTIAFAACIMGTAAFTAGTTTAKASAPKRVRQDTLSTQSGVYTDEQAKRGEQTFLGICVSCHAPSEQTGDEFDQHWKDHPLSDLFQYLLTQMPQNDPGSLDPYVTVDVVAYMLKLNAMPAGTTELAPDTTVLKTIRITRIKGPTP